ncbi:hypothetical protein RBH88_11700 [Aminobacterium sp. MB27-C1]|uniref:hypothetical protein n=1 Tax=Aminobacterium sp. MB27-C1 TaxID=3070661 RepID=UPI0027DB2A3A|nr:hypothetical protein [Aminobacterium sp. MB27-C1]WMI71503.1 hypothetical protein RBH88_11700 [Aminobacterium sp. MB27-C1]
MKKEISFTILSRPLCGKGLDEIENGYYAQYWDQIKREPQGRFKSKLRGDIICCFLRKSLPNLGMVFRYSGFWHQKPFAPVAALKKATPSYCGGCCFIRGDFSS